MRSPCFLVTMPAVIAAVLVTAASSAHAQRIEPRAYINAPVGVNFLALGYVNSQGALLFDPSLPVDRKNSIKLFGHSGVSTRTGTDYDSLGIFWQYRWGGGI